MRTRQTKKMYLARVKGRFPSPKLFELPVLETLGPVEAVAQSDALDESKGTASEELTNHEPTEDAQNSKRMRIAEAGTTDMENKADVPTKVASPAQLSRKSRRKDKGADGNKKKPTNDSNREDGEEESAFQGLVRIGYHINEAQDSITLRYPLSVVSFREGIHECNAEGSKLVARLCFKSSTQISKMGICTASFVVSSQGNLRKRK